MAFGEFVADKVNLRQAAYGDWAQSVTRWAMANRNRHRPTIESWYTTHSTLPRNNRAIAAMAPDIVNVRHVGALGLHRAIPARPLATE